MDCAIVLNIDPISLYFWPNLLRRQKFTLRFDLIFFSESPFCSGRFHVPGERIAANDAMRARISGSSVETKKCKSVAL